MQTPREGPHKITAGPRWHTLGAFRGCDAHWSEHGINYTAVTEAHGPDAVAAMIAAGDRAGMLCPPGPHDCPGYAALDIRGADGEIIDDRCIPTREAFDWWVRAVELRVDMSDCPVDTPEAHAATYASAAAACEGRWGEAAAITLDLVHGGAR